MNFPALVPPRLPEPPALYPSHPAHTTTLHPLSAPPAVFQIRILPSVPSLRVAGPVFEAFSVLLAPIDAMKITSFFIYLDFSGKFRCKLIGACGIDKKILKFVVCYLIGKRQTKSMYFLRKRNNHQLSSTKIVIFFRNSYFVIKPRA